MLETLERLLFNRPGWLESIRCAQSELGFGSDFAAAQLQYWETRHGYREVLEIALAEVEKQGLPPYFALYWTVCFYANCERGVTRIVWPANWSAEADIQIASRIASAMRLSCTDGTPKAMAVWGFGFGEKRKVYPPYPFILSIPPLFTAIDSYTKKPVSSRTEVLSVVNIAEIHSRFYCRLCDTKDDRQPNFVVKIPDEFRNKEVLKLAYWLSYRLKLYTKSVTMLTEAGDKGIAADYSIRLWGYRHKVSGGVPPTSLSDLKRVVTEHGPRRLSSDVHRAKVRSTYKSPEITRGLERYASGQANFADLLREEWLSRGVQSALASTLERYDDKGKRITIERKWRKLVYRRVRRRLEKAGFKPPPPTPGWWLQE